MLITKEAIQRLLETMEIKFEQILDYDATSPSVDPLLVELSGFRVVGNLFGIFNDMQFFNLGKFIYNITSSGSSLASQPEQIFQEWIARWLSPGAKELFSSKSSYAALFKSDEDARKAVNRLIQCIHDSLACYIGDNELFKINESFKYIQSFYSAGYILGIFKTDHAEDDLCQLFEKLREKYKSKALSFEDAFKIGSEATYNYLSYTGAELLGRLVEDIEEDELC